MPSINPTDTGIYFSYDFSLLATCVPLQDSEGSICADVVHVGQLVPCIILRVDDDNKEGKVNKRVWLSLRLSRIYKGLSLDAIQDGMVSSTHPGADALSV